nr:MAG TPA: hypothetical protein [Bacteriophage sp.]
MTDITFIHIYPLLAPQEKSWAILFQKFIWY